MKTKIFNLIELLFTVLPIKYNRILFISFSGKYNDNPFYISKYLESKRNLELIWVIDRKSKSIVFSTNVKIIRLYSIKHAYYSRTARVIIDYGAGYKNIIKNKGPFDFLYKLYKKKSQFNISTWHGTPMKKIGINIPNTCSNFVFSTSDMILAGCNFTKKILSDSFPYIPRVELTGTPRNDVLINCYDRDYICDIKNRLRIPHDKKVMLYAPTYRNNPQYSGLIQLSTFNYKELFHVLKKRFGGDWIFIFRIHQMSINSLIKKGITDNKNVYNGNLIDDMAECLVISDALITDFSGALFDFALTKKPCFLYAIDTEDYENNERGFNIDIESLPYAYSNTFKGLLRNISEYNQTQAIEKIALFLDQLGNIEDGKASMRIGIFIESIVNCKSNLPIVTPLKTKNTTNGNS